jgi:SAM-dependent methyltransferase
LIGYRPLSPFITPGKGLLLELGARRSANRIMAERKGYDYVGIDIDYYRELSAVGDAHFVPFKDGSFDHVLLPCVLEHFRDPRVALDEIFRITKPGGEISGSVAFMEPFHHSYFHFSHAAVIDALTTAGFTNLLIDTGANVSILISSRLFAAFFNLHNRKVVILLTRILFPINLAMRVMYGALLLKNVLLRRDLTVFRARFEEFRREMALRLASHIYFSATKPA